MEKESKGLMILVAILLIIVVGLGGYITYDKLSSKDINQEKPNGKNNTTNVEDLTEAERLVKEFAYVLRYRSLDETDSTTDHENYIKILKAYSYMKTELVKLASVEKSCSTQSECAEVSKTYEIKYEDLNDSYKYLFGKNEKLPKNTYSFKPTAFKYDESTNKYIATPVVRQSGDIYYYGYKVNSAIIENNTLKVNVSYSDLPLYDGLDKGKSPYTGTIYNYDEIQKFVDAEYQQFDKYEFVFEYENGHYIFKDIVKA